MAVQARRIRRRREDVAGRQKAAASQSAPAAGRAPKIADLWLGTQLRALRKAKQLSLAELAAGAELSIGMVSQIERGLASPSIRSLRKLGEALGVPISWFF